MQPCATCGGTEVDLSGNCTRCGTYRGQQSYDIATPGGEPPYSGPGYGAPSSGPGYGAPTSGGPGYGPGYAGPPYGGQASGPPYGGGPYPGAAPPQQGYQGYQGYQQPYQGAPYQAAPGGRGRSFMVPLLALSAVLVILVVGIVAVVVIRNDNNGGDQPPGAIVDTCVVGTWRVVKQTEKVLLDTGGTAEYTVSEYTVVLRADGTGHIDHNGTTLKTTVSGTPVTLVVNGKVDFEFRTNSNQYTESNFRTEGTTTTTVGNQQPKTEPFTVSARPATYKCDSTSMTQDTELSHTEFRKQ